MYSTCLFCNGALGTNAVIEAFPVGRRLAFDAARGRLWVVCPACRRWNLSPLEERWEAIEDCERRFRDTKLRVSTGEIGLARLREGLELVRVGAPQRPEIAAWRYGEQFGARRRRQLLVTGAVLGAGGLALTGGVVAGVGVVTTYQVGRMLMKVARHGLPQATVARFRGPGSEVLRVRRKHLPHSSLLTGADGRLAFDLAHSGGKVHLEGEDALRAARQLFPAINRRGGAEVDVGRAVAHLEHAGDAERFLVETARRGPRITRPMSKGELRAYADPEEAAAGAGLLSLSTSLGLAIEMALNEEQERRALEGELAELEDAWREAEEVAAIADDLLLPEPVERAWARLRQSL